MRSLVLIVLLALAGIVGYSFINKPAEKVTNEVIGEESITEEVATPVKSEESSSANESASVETAALEADDANTITPADMPEEARHQMFASMVDYNKCMMHDKPEYHQADLDVKDVAGKTMESCESKLVTLKAILEANHVNSGLRDGMIRTVRQRAIRKFMAALMQSQAADLMASPTPSTTP